MATVIIAPEAEAQCLAIDAWWLQNRPAAPDLFNNEFRAAIEQLRSAASDRSPNRAQ